MLVADALRVDGAADHERDRAGPLPIRPADAKVLAEGLAGGRANDAHETPQDARVLLERAEAPMERLTALGHSRVRQQQARPAHEAYALAIARDQDGGGPAGFDPDAKGRAFSHGASPGAPSGPGSATPPR